eukprot:766844-Hanusia_phi.AAC.3
MSRSQVETPPTPTPTPPPTRPTPPAPAPAADRLNFLSILLPCQGGRGRRVPRLDRTASGE